MNKKILRIVMAACLAAFTCLSTMISVPLAFGYVHVGDALVLLCGYLLGPLYGFLAAALGSALADLLLGYVIYAPLTFFLKGGMACLIALIVLRKTKRAALLSSFLGAVLAELLMAAGYFVFETLLYGVGGALSTLPMNLLQGGITLCIAPLLFSLLPKRKLP